MLPSPDNILREELPNGIIVLAHENPNCQSVNVNGYLQAGALSEPDEKLGLADFTASMLMRGTQQRNFQQIYDELESVGASFAFGSSTHTTAFGGKALAEDLGVLLNILADALRFPIFPVEQVERKRGQLLTHLAIRAQDTGSLAAMAFDKIVYADHPYSRPADGYPETVNAITRNDLAAFQRIHYGPRGMVISVVGALQPDRMVEMVQSELGGWQNPEQPLPISLLSFKPLTQTTTQRVSIPGKSQVDLLMGAAGPERRHPDYLAVSLGNHILGQFGMSGRIGEIVREQEGLAYYAFSSLSGGVGPGPWYIGAGVAPENVERVIELIQNEVVRFTTEAVSDEELEDTVSYFTGVLPLSMETNEGMASAILNMERYQLGLDFYLRYTDILQAVTPEKILAAVPHFLQPDRMGIAMAGTLEA